MKNIHIVGRYLIGQKRGTYEDAKAFLKGRKQGLFVNIGQFPCSLIRIQDSQMIRIRNTGFHHYDLFPVWPFTPTAVKKKLGMVH